MLLNESKAMPLGFTREASVELRTIAGDFSPDVSSCPRRYLDTVLSTASVIQSAPVASNARPLGCATPLIVTVGTGDPLAASCVRSNRTMVPAAKFATQSERSASNAIAPGPARDLDVEVMMTVGDTSRASAP